MYKWKPLLNDEFGNGVNTRNDRFLSSGAVSIRRHSMQTFYFAGHWHETDAPGNVTPHSRDPAKRGELK